MKLISLYIEQFGGLRQYRLDFEEGLTVLQADNGFGKTTLAEFIRAMFYGFPRKTKTLGRRQKYLPWSGGKCAGNLEFEFEGTRYRIERTFGATPKSDTFRLMEAQTNRPSSRFTENIGIALFGLDADSFERSTYLPQNALTEDLATDSIRAKLSDLVEDAGDVGNFEKATAALKNKRSSYALYRGVGGSVAEANARITRLQLELAQGSQAKRELETVRGEIVRLEQEKQTAAEELKLIRTRISQASEAASVAAAQRQHRQLAQQLRIAETQEKAYAPRFAQGVPTREELEEQRRRCNDYLTLTAQARSLGLSPEERSELEQLRGPYLAGELEEQRLDGLRETLRQLDKLGEIEEAAPMVEPEPKRPALLPMVWLTVGAIALMLGIVLLIRGSYLPGGIGAGLGALGLIFGAVQGIRAMISRELAGNNALRYQMERERANRAAEAAVLTRRLKEALGDCGDYSRAIMELHLRRERYLDLDAEDKRTKAEAEKGLRQAAELWQTVEAFLGRYFDQKVQPADGHGLLDNLAREGDAFLQAAGQRQLAERALAEFRAGHSRELAAPEMTEVPELQPLRAAEWEQNQRLDELNEELLALRQRRADLRDIAEQLPELEDQAAAWQEKKLADQKMADLLDATVAFLQEAKDSLSSSYLGPVREGFGRYLQKLSDTSEGRAHIDPDLKLQLERQGAARELAYFSAGQADLVMLCMRLALVDALFRGEKPFVILDDPFVNLDDKRTAAALELLQELSRERQVLYLVCNSSRKIG